MGDIDMENRDPNGLNDHIKVQFEDVIGEPDGAHSIDCVWSLAYCCFNFGKNCCYKLMTILCAAPMALCWGCEFAVLTFQHVWYNTPCLRVCVINLGCAQKFWSACVNCFCSPICEAYGMCFSNIQVTNLSG